MKIRLSPQTPYSPKSEEDFVRYCRLYDPFLQIDNPVSEFEDVVDDLGDSIYGEGRSTEEIKVYWRCASYLSYISPHNDQTSSEKGSGQTVRDYILMKFKYFYEVREYIYYELNDCSFQWAVVRRWKVNNVDRYKFLGVGSTISDADELSAKKYSNFLRLRDESIRFILEKDLPSPGTYDFIKLGKKYNLKFDEDSVQYIISDMPSAVSTNITNAVYSIEGVSEGVKYRVNVNLKDREFMWVLERFEPVRLRFSGESIGSVIQQHNKEYNRLRSDPQGWQNALQEAEAYFEAEIDTVLIQEGAEHIDWLIFEYGEDALPDRG